MFEKCAPPIPVAVLIGRSGFGNAVGSVEAAARDDNQEITFLGICLICNNAAVCCGRIWFKFLLLYGLIVWKSLERESVMIFSIPFMCCDYMDVLLLTSVHPSHHATALWD